MKIDEVDSWMLQRHDGAQCSKKQCPETVKNLHWLYSLLKRSSIATSDFGPMTVQVLLNPKLQAS